MKDRIWLFPVADNPHDLSRAVVKYFAIKSVFTTDAMGGCVDFRLGDGEHAERSLLSYFWQLLEPQIVGRPLAGWRLYDRAWPLLVNRSLANGVPVPAWARHDPAKRYATRVMYDLYNILTQGKRLEPQDRDVSLGMALALWLPDWPAIPDWKFDEPVPHEYGCLCLEGMEKVAERYEA